VRVVLDTNVCLDAFVFADPRAATLVAALEAGEVQAVTREDCRAEWLAVLGYPALKLDDARRQEAMARFDRYVTLLPDDASPVERTDAPLRADAPLRPDAPRRAPRCRDPDDQMFLELAVSAGATVLFSRDSEVLRLARRTKREGLFDITTPEAWKNAQPR